MKNIILGLLVLLTIQSLAQNDFRKMSWGDSVSKLKSQYPNAKWTTETLSDVKAYSFEDFVGGLKAQVIFAFVNNKLQMGSYSFLQEYSSGNLFYEDFKTISNILNRKYNMEINEEWNDDTWKNNPNYIGFALRMGNVEINETYSDDKTMILHQISSDGNGGINHMLAYYDMAYVKSNRDSQLDDF